MKDLIDELQAGARSVGAADLPAGAAHVIRVTRSYDADIADVWDAVTSEERIARWFLPVSGDLRLGGTYQLEGNAGGEIRVCEPPRHLQVTWNFGPPPGPDDASVVDLRLESSGDATQLELVHTAVVPPEMWDQFGPGAVGVGWDLTLLGLSAHLSGAELGSPSELEADPAMHAVMRASSTAWGVALAESGADAATVDRLVAATTEFYVPSAG